MGVVAVSGEIYRAVVEGAPLGIQTIALSSLPIIDTGHINRIVTTWGEAIAAEAVR